MKFRDFHKKHAYLVIIAVVLLLAFLPPVEVHDEQVSIGGGHPVTLTKQAETHILYGDHRGGGHIHGADQPCKSEFPKDWDAEDVIATVTKQAANDNLRWRQEDNGYHVSEKMHGNVKVRVVMDDDRSHIVTAYPVNQPRNPCNVK